MDISDRLRAHRDDVVAIAERHGARNVRVFGSISQGTDRPDSDVDLLVDVGPERTPFFPGGLVADLEELLGCSVDVITPQAVHWYIRDQVLREAVPL